jgi:hypothetical protein
VGEAVVKCHDDFDADDVVVKVNFGGDMDTEVVKQAAERVHQRGERQMNLIRVKEVSASRGKAMRAEPTIGPGRADAVRKPDDAGAARTYRGLSQSRWSSQGQRLCFFDFQATPTKIRRSLQQAQLLAEF